MNNASLLKAERQHSLSLGIPNRVTILGSWYQLQGILRMNIVVRGPEIDHQVALQPVDIGHHRRPVIGRRGLLGQA